MTSCHLATGHLLSAGVFNPLLNISLIGWGIMITSLQNKQVKDWVKLHTRKGRMKTGTFLIEGHHLVEEAHNSEWDIKELIVQQDIQVPSWAESVTVNIVNEAVFKHIAQTTTPQGIAAVVYMAQPKKITGNEVLLIDQVQDPGNLGTMIRTADAAGFSAVILGNGTVDMYNDKVIRASQGSIFHLPILEGNLIDYIKMLKEDGFSIWAAALEQSQLYHEVEKQNKIALIVGNEGAGIQENFLKEADTIVKIPIYGQAESLNVSIAAGILMYHIKG